MNLFSRHKKCNFNFSFFRKIFAFPLIFILLLSAVYFSACTSIGSEKHFTAFKNTAVTVQSRNKSLSSFAEQQISELLISLNTEFSATEDSSTVYKINSALTGEKTEISERLKSVAKECGKMYEFTGGKFDPSVYPFTLLWQFAPNFPVPDFTLPSAEEITTTKALIGFDKFDFEDGAVKTLTKAKLDFGGALKGYAADKIAEIIKADGVTEGFVNVGGSSIYIIKTETLSITHPREDGNILTVKIKETDLSVSTSGDYEKVYSLNGKYYSHIINPETGYPADSGVASATVIGKNGLLLDALTTAMCVCSHDFENPTDSELYNFLIKTLNSEDFKGVQIFVVCCKDEKKQILTNKKQGENFTLLDSSYQIISVI